MLDGARGDDRRRPLEEALTIRSGLRLADTWLDYATNAATKDLFWQMAAHEQAVHEAFERSCAGQGIDYSQ